MRKIMINMKDLNKMKTEFRNISFLFCFLLLIFNSCKEDIRVWPKTSEDQVINEFVQANPDKYGEFGKLIMNSHLNFLLSIRGPFTLMLPTDSAMRVFYASKGITSIDGLDSIEQRNIVLNHVIPNVKLQVQDFSTGRIGNTNALKEYLVNEYSGTDLIINKSSKITRRNIPVSNGVIHEINQVLEPAKYDLYGTLRNNPSYKIFADGLEKSGLMDTLKVVSFPYGGKEARTEFTILAVADTTFNRFGIKSVDDLIAKYSSTMNPDSLKVLSNGFFRFMEYHCIAGTYFYSELLAVKPYYVLSNDNVLRIEKTEGIIKINNNRVTKKYISFYNALSNIPAKNGALHTVNDILPVTEPELSEVIFQTTDYFDIKHGEYYKKYYQKFYPGKDNLQGIKFDGPYLQYYFKIASGRAQIDNDCLNMMGFWMVEITTPKIMKGKYRLSAFIWKDNGANDFSDYDVYIDGELSVSLKQDETYKDDYPVFGDFNWTETKEHKIKLVATSYGLLFWDWVKFTPIK